MRMFLCSLLLLILPLFSVVAQDAVWPTPKPLDNAAPLYFRGFICANYGPEIPGQDAEAALNALEKDGTYDAKPLNALVENNAVALGLLHQAAAIDNCDFGIEYASGIAGELPELSRARRLARMAMAAAVKAGNDGDWPKAIETYTDVLRLVRHLNMNGTLLHALVGMNIAGKVFDRGGWLLSNMPPDDARYGRLIDTLATVRLVVTSLDVALDNEVLLFSPYAPPPGTVWSPEQVAKAYSAVFGVFSERNPAATIKAEVFTKIAAGTASAEEQQAVADAFRCTPQELSGSNLSVQLTRQIQGLMRGLQEARALMRTPFINARSQLQALDASSAPDFFLLHLVYRNLAQLDWADCAAEAKLGLLQTAAMVLRWRIGQHTIPQDVAQVPGIPPDPFTMGVPFKYEPSATGDFTLASVGADESKPNQPITLQITPAWKLERKNSPPSTEISTD